MTVAPPAMAAAQTTAPPASAAASASGSASVAAEWLARATRPTFRALTDPDGGVAIEYPAKDWLVLSGGVASVVTFVQKKGEASLVIERTALAQALAPDEVTDVFAQFETEAIKQRAPRATGLEAHLLDAGGRRVIGIQYQRPGPLGSELVRQYSFPIGHALYRLSCVTTADRLARYGPICAHMAASFTAGASARAGR